MSPFSTETTAATASRRPCLRLQMAVFLNRRSRDAILPDRHRPMLRKDVFGLEYRNAMLEPRMSTQEERHDGTNHADDPRPVGL